MRYRLGLFVSLFLLLVVGGAYGQNRTVRGTVTDELSGEPITFPQINVQGTSIGTIGDENGNFVLEDAPGAEFVLVATRIGYVSIEVTVAAGQNSVSFTMTVDYLRVEELVVTGIASEIARINLPNSVGTVDGDELLEVPQETIDKSIQGRISGAVISQNSGAPGGGIQLNLRGSSSINAAAEPLYIIDGVIATNVGIPSNQNVITNAAGGANPSLDQDNLQNRIADINPQDIESIEVLKGASAAAIYGSKASNGVVIIKTRQGRAGRVTVDVRGIGGFYDLSNKVGFRTFQDVNEATTAFGSAAEELFNTGQTFDHEEELAGRNALSFELAGRVSGGAQNGLQYFASALWKQDEGIVENTGFERQSLRANLRIPIGSKAVVNVQANGLRTNAGRGITNNDNAQVSYFMVFPATPNFIDLRQQPDGTFPVNSFLGNGSNPLQTAALIDQDEEVWRGIGSANLDWALVEGGQTTFRLLANLGVDYFNQGNRIFSPPELHFESFDGLLGTALQSNSRSTNINMGAAGVWDYTLSGGSSVRVSGGVQYDTRNLDVNRTVGQNLTGGKNKTDAATQVDITEVQAQIEDFGFFGQGEWLGIDDRLLLIASGRFDQSSANADPTKIFFYPKAAVSYRIPTSALGLTELKVRGAFGQTGNQPLFGQKFSNLRVDNNIEGIPGLTTQGDVAADDLRPERMTEIEGGIDLQGWDGRGTLGLTGFWQNISDLIIQRQVAPSTGFTNQLFNGGTLRNWGIEVDLGLTPVTTAKFTWLSRTVFSFNKTTVSSLPVPGFEAEAGFGLGLGGFFIEEGASLTQIIGTDPDSPREDGLAKLGDTNPDFIMGFTNDFTFGDFRLYTLFEWRYGMEIINLTQLLFDASLNSVDFGTFQDFVDASGDPTFSAKGCHPNCSGAERLGGFVNGYARAYTQPAGFFKARDISLSYNLPGSVLGTFRNVALRLSARNLFTITNYDGLDPEVSNFGNQQVGRSIDVAPFPPSRSIWFGVDLSF